MRKFIKDPEIYIIIGVLGLSIATPSENFYVNSILVPISMLFLIGGVFFTVKKYMNEEKAAKQRGKKR
ncbi:MAG: hypothetical protein K0S47_4468 [Herbinix sp.]|jgi:hypothetical protein|nr:hypothetical protein [Herbinix sp.]